MCNKCNKPTSTACCVAAAEINYVRKCFLALPAAARIELACALRSNPTDSLAFKAAGLELFCLLLKASPIEVSIFVRDELCKEIHVPFYYLTDRNRVMENAAICANYFRDNLTFNGQDYGIEPFKTLELVPV